MLLTLAQAGQATRFALCFEGRLADELRSTGADVRLLGAVRFSKPWTILQARRALRRLRGACFIFHGCWTFAALAPGVKGMARRLLAIHDIPQGSHWVERLAKAAGPDGLVANSRATAKAAASLFTDTAIVVIEPPVARSSKLALEDRRRIRQGQGTSPDETVILLASRWEPLKGHAILIEALGRLGDRKDWRVWIAGGTQRDWEHAFADQIRQRCQALGIADRVAFLGHRDDVTSLMGAADLYCQPNLGPEGFGVSFVEALQAGLPVVTSPMGGALDLIDESRGVFVPSGDATALAATIRSLLDDPDRRRALGQAGQAWVRDRFDPARIGEKWRTL